ncbi:MAG: hypothetical protein R3A10_18010 [Caldilineaceae bacterium]
MRLDDTTSAGADPSCRDHRGLAAHPGPGADAAGAPVQVLASLATTVNDACGSRAGCRRALAAYRALERRHAGRAL